MGRMHLLAAVAIALMASAGSAAEPWDKPAGRSMKQAQAKPLPPQPRALPLVHKPWTGDFDRMLEIRRVRVLAPYSRTFFFNDRGRERGYAADLVRTIEPYLNTKWARQLGKRPLTFVLIPTTRDKLLSGVAEGRGDIAVNLKVTDERKRLVDFFVAPDTLRLAEVVVTGPRSPGISTIDDLSGQTVHARPSSAYHEGLVALNERFKKAGKPPVTIVAVPDALEDEDMMEMLNVGLLQVIVVDDLVAKMWAAVLPKVKVHNDVVLQSGVRGWAIRKNSPLLQQALMDAYVAAIQKTPMTLAARLRGYQGRIRQLHDPTRSADYKRFQQTLALFTKYGARYAFDPLMLAAQGYQESQLNQAAKSPVGAIGIMQVMPATGKELRVGDITRAEPNVHAGTKYMDQLMKKEYPGATFDEQNRTLFAFAAYNCGPGKMASIRRAAEERGLAPDIWFNNVEIVTAEKVGIETTRYVRNIYKYYVSYKLMLDVQAAQKAAREAVKK